MLTILFISIFVLQTAFGIYLFEKSWKKTQPLRDIDQQFEEKYPAFRRRDRWALTALTIPVKVRKVDFDYSEYLGQNYKESQIIPAHGPSAIVAGGHTCFADTIAMISKYECNFAAKQSLEHWPLLGLIVNRMKLIEKTGQYTKLAIYPEGSTANGEFILPLKRGAFLSNTSILPIILNYKSNKISIAKDSIYQKWLLFLSSMEFFDVSCEIIECPIFIPNDYLYQKHKNQGQEKWEIYAWAIRDIYSKASGKQKLDVPLKQKLEYENLKKEMGQSKRTKGE
ncbi:acyltransferase family protein [Stylonychia lemnae]|uniref:Acyltransferase family protein n=1 Tax=Stylonychia lemnae TaxID=5949 RepID=A0A078A3J2_STYLE|nr:acyltransferase family protein [Stylonychia lemnae]|eukprot:CDW76747.1 acyltransferase family protein [Stylonychia lemnae]